MEWLPGPTDRPDETTGRFRLDGPGFNRPPQRPAARRWVMHGGHGELGAIASSSSGPHLSLDTGPPGH